MKVCATISTRFALLVALFFVCAGMQMEVRRQSSELSLQPMQPEQQAQQDQTDRQNTMEILPPSYIGCWQGMVSAPDSTMDLNGCMSGPFVPELYTLCYRKNLNGRFELTFGGVELDTEVPPQYQISGTNSKVEVLASDGVAKVRLRSFVHFDQKQMASRASSGGDWSMDEETNMACEIKDGSMDVAASYAQTSDGSECFRGTWHTRFHRFDK